MMTSTPTFGSCVLSGVARCALSPHLCTPSETYRPARSTTGCDLASSVLVGRCTGSNDDWRCAATRDACYFPLAFDASGGIGSKDPPDDVTLGECNLHHGEGDDGYTLFPLCRDKEEGLQREERLRCVLFKEECNGDTEDLISATWALDWTSYDSCKCHDVPVGVCHSPGLSPGELTADNSHCAVGAWDCRDDRSAFLSAVDSLDLPGISCRLCRDVELRTGACVGAETSGVVKCALESSACPSDTTFLSSRQIEAQGQGQATTTMEATCTSALEVSLGECTSENDEVECVAHKDACSYIRKYEERSECNLMGNDKTKTPSYYGTCNGKPGQPGYNYRNPRCVWGREECHPMLEVYRAARAPQSWFEGCPCEKVRTGVCIDDGMEESPYCAVSAGACSPGNSSRYVPAADLANEGLGGLDCRLCRDRGDYVAPLASSASADEGGEEDKNVPAATPSTVEGVMPAPPEPSMTQPKQPPTPVAPPRPRPEPLPASPVESVMAEFEEEPRRAAIMVGSILGTVLAVFIIILGMAFMYKRLGKNPNEEGISNQTFKGSRDVGMEVGEGSSFHDMT